MPIAQDVRKIAEEIEVSYGERVAYLSDLFAETNNTLKEFRRQHQKMTDDLWDFLVSDQDSRERLVKELRGKNKKDLEEMAKRTREELRSTTKKRTEEVKEMVSGFAKEHQARAEKLQQELLSFQDELKRKVKNMRAASIGDLKETQQTWQNLARIMAAKRAGKTVTPKEKIKEVPQKEVAEAAEAFAEGELKQQAMRLIVEAPEGMTLSEMGKALKVPYVRLARPVSELIKEEKVEKVDSRYFKV